VYRSARDLSGGFGGELRCELRAGEQQKQDPSQGGLAACRVVPLVERMNAASAAPSSDGQSWNAERERQIGVGRA